MNPNTISQFPFRKLANVLTTVALGALALSPASARPATSGSFTLIEPMKQFRKQHTATILLDGKVLVVGGQPLVPATTSELYDPVTSTWTNSGPLHAGRIFHTAALLQNGSVMVTGGQTANQLLGSTEIYDPPSGRWI